ncbi:methyltransferase domain-containing protein [Trueperella pyogenes]|uniref:methyltransferase domain-containing protein n=1 Tax=Trueperella pyogenes TaxID=1661 RepID=UPI00345D547E
MADSSFPPRSGSDIAQVDTEITVENGCWTFSHGVANSFVSHVRKSVPLYDDGHFMAAELASCFSLPNGTAYELGVSTGELIAKLACHNARTQSVNWIGIDCENEMIAKAREHCAGLKNVELIEANLENFSFETCDFVVDFLTRQFLSHSKKIELFKNIFESLREGGAFFTYSKILQQDAFFQELALLLYSRFKTYNGLSAEHVVTKSESVYGVIKPETSASMIDALRCVGFEKVTPVIRYMNFEGFLAVK